MTAVHSRRRIAWAATVALLAAASASALAAPASAVPASSSAAHGLTTHYAIDQPACAQPSNPDANRCYALRRVNVAKTTPGARAYTVRDGITYGLAGGFTPADLASAYGYNASAATGSQVVGIVDWYDDPAAATDLTLFDKQYHLAPETSTSFRKVNQNGLTTPLPVSTGVDAQDESIEIALDVESVRAVCHTCKILLVEANTPDDADLAAAENTAVKMGATEVSNSWGAAENSNPPSHTLLSAMNHPGVVITAATGDDGWFGWDYANDIGGRSDGAPSYPATDPHVVSVGGTTLNLSSSGARASETVWDSDGQGDYYGLVDGVTGATGGGCSTLFTAPSWQAKYPGYSAAGCGGNRLATDISADADPATGLDIIDKDATSPGWMTIGGTSLASPIVAAMYALGGGAHGVSYPAATLYENHTHRPSSLYDVVGGGNSFCGGASTTSCSNYVYASFNGGHYNPNALGKGPIDCSYPASGDSATPPPLSSECNAAKGYDGPSGLGTPAGSGVFTLNTPTVTLTRSATSTTSTTFTAHVTEPIAGIAPVSYAWNFGDRHTATTTGTSKRHTYAKAGTYTATLTVTDSVNQHRSVSTKFTVGRPASIRTSGPSSVHRGKTGSFRATVKTPNTGAKIIRVTWSWGDKKKTTATNAKHAWSRDGTYTIKITVLDSAGVSTSTIRRVKVLA